MPRSSSIFRLSLALLLLVGLGSAAWAKPKVAILGLEVSNSGAVDPKDAVNASKLTDELRKFVQGGATRYELSSSGNRELQDEKLMGNCDTERPSCMAPIGAGMQAEFLVYGRIEKQRDGYKVSIKILNVKQKLIEETWEGAVKTSEIGTPALKDWAQRVHAKLAGEKLPVAVPERAPEKLPAKLVVRVGNTASGEVFVNGARKGMLEGGALTLTLPEGTHLLAIEAADRRRYEETVTVTSGQTKTVSVEMEQVVTAPLPVTRQEGGGGSGKLGLKIAGFAMLGAAAAAGGYATYLTFDGPIEDYEKIMADPFSDSTGNTTKKLDSDDCGNTAARKRRTADAMPDPNELFDKACRANGQRLIFGIVGGVLAAGGVTTLYFAYRDSRPATEKRAANGRKRRELQVTPVVSANGAGATVRFDW